MKRWVELGNPFYNPWAIVVIAAIGVVVVVAASLGCQP